MATGRRNQLAIPKLGVNGTSFFVAKLNELLNEMAVGSGRGSSLGLMNERTEIVGRSRT